MNNTQAWKVGILLVGVIGLWGADTRANLPGEPGPRLVRLWDGSEKWLSAEELDLLAVQLHERGRCGGYMDITDFQGEPDRDGASPDATLWLRSRDLSQGELIEELLGELSAANLHDSVEKLSSWENRYYRNESGVEAARWIRDQFTELSKDRDDVAVDEFEHSFPQPSIIARITGKHETLREEIVLIGAHEDSINLYSSSAPGADDDASGVATVLEVFRVLAQSGYQPDRTLEFMTYGGEERGLLGSQAIAKKYVAGQKKVVAALQLDMTFYPGSVKEITLISDYVSADLTGFLGELLDAYVKVSWGKDKCGYACSDHASWHKAGYASAFPFESPFDEYNPKIHTSGDTLANDLDWEFGLGFAKLALAFAVELGTEGEL